MEQSSPIAISQRVKLILHANLVHPTQIEQNNLVDQIRQLSLEECEFLYGSLRKQQLLKPPFPLKHNDIRRIKRTKHYVQNIKKVSGPFLRKLGKGNMFCDLGCGTGVITVDVLGSYSKRGGIIYGCDVTNYVDESLKEYITFTQQDTFLFLKTFANDSLDGIMSVVMLHHLSSRAKFGECIREMARVIKPQGLVILVETVHHTWEELLKNAVLDKLLNERTNDELHCHIPTPLTLFSDKELREELRKNKLTLLKKSRMRATTADPKFHSIYICRKESV
jgi:ubiquinone/menaquinone biosynthesis C-methylase UbiE